MVATFSLRGYTLDRFNIQDRSREVQDDWTEFLLNQRFFFFCSQKQKTHTQKSFFFKTTDFNSGDALVLKLLRFNTVRNFTTFH